MISRMSNCQKLLIKAMRLYFYNFISFELSSKPIDN